MRRMLEVKEYKRAGNVKEVNINKGLSIKDDGDVEVGKNLDVDGVITQGGQPLSGGTQLYKHTLTGTNFEVIIITNDNAPLSNTLNGIPQTGIAVACKIKYADDGLYYNALLSDESNHSPTQSYWYKAYIISAGQLKTFNLDNLSSPQLTDVVTAL